MTHVMTLVSSDNGKDTFLCPTCGRMFELVWSPYSKKVLVVGDETVQHSGSKCPPGLTLSIAATVSDPSLEPFERWAEGRDQHGDH